MESSHPNKTKINLYNLCLHFLYDRKVMTYQLISNEPSASLNRFTKSVNLEAPRVFMPKERSVMELKGVSLVMENTEDGWEMKVKAFPGILCL